MQLQKRFGLRYSEVSSIRNMDILNDQYIFVRGKKRSRNRILFAPDLIRILLKHITGSPSTLVFSVSYAQYFHFVAKHVPLQRTRKNGNRRVTHFFRAKIIQSLASKKQVEFEDIKQFTGHKSKKSIPYYLRKWKQE